MSFTHQYMVVVVLCCVFQGCGYEPEILDLPTNPVLEDVQALVFDGACATSGCHDISAAGQLDLSDAATSRANLVNTPSINKAAKASGWPRIAPGRPDDSYLVRKLSYPGLGEGAAMPIGTRLTDPYVDLIVMWVEDGAQ